MGSSFAFVPALIEFHEIQFGNLYAILLIHRETTNPTAMIKYWCFFVFLTHNGQIARWLDR